VRIAKGPMAPMSNLSILQELARDRAAREGMQSRHSPKNLANEVLIEASKLASGFSWMSSKDSIILAHQPADRERLSGQVVDMVYLLLRLADELGINLESAVSQSLRRQDSTS